MTNPRDWDWGLLKTDRDVDMTGAFMEYLIKIAPPCLPSPDFRDYRYEFRDYPGKEKCPIDGCQSMLKSASVQVHISRTHRRSGMVYCPVGLEVCRKSFLRKHLAFCIRRAMMGEQEGWRFERTLNPEVFLTRLQDRIKGLLTSQIEGKVSKDPDQDGEKICIPPDKDEDSQSKLNYKKLECAQPEDDDKGMDLRMRTVSDVHANETTSRTDNQLVENQGTADQEVPVATPTPDITRVGKIDPKVRKHRCIDSNTFSSRTTLLSILLRKEIEIPNDTINDLLLPDPNAPLDLTFDTVTKRAELMRREY